MSKLLRTLTGEWLAIVGTTKDQDAIVIVPTVFGTNTFVRARDITNPLALQLCQYNSDCTPATDTVSIHRDNLLLGSATVLPYVMWERQMECNGWNITACPESELEEELLLESGFHPYNIDPMTLQPVPNPLGLVWARQPA